jgi:hypothetical protein
MGRMTIELPAIPGRKARQAVVALRFGAVVVSRPKNSRPKNSRRIMGEQPQWNGLRRHRLRRHVPCG